MFTPTQALLHPTRRTHTAHTYQFPSCPLSGALDQHKVSALDSRVGWSAEPLPAITNERTIPVAVARSSSGGNAIGTYVVYFRFIG